MGTCREEDLTWHECQDPPDPTSVSITYFNCWNYPTLVYVFGNQFFDGLPAWRIGCLYKGKKKKKREIVAHKENRLWSWWTRWHSDLGANSVLAAVPRLSTSNHQLCTLSSQERPLRKGQRRHLKHPNYLLKFDQLFRDVTVDPVNRGSIVSWTITKREHRTQGNAWSRNIKWC